MRALPSLAMISRPKKTEKHNLLGFLTTWGQGFFSHFIYLKRSTKHTETNLEEKPSNTRDLKSFIEYTTFLTSSLVTS